jgi:hypothetical protein
VYTINKNTDAQIEINARPEQTNDILMHHHQNAYKYHNKIMANYSMIVQIPGKGVKKSKFYP